MILIITLTALVHVRYIVRKLLYKKLVKNTEIEFSTLIFLLQITGGLKNEKIENAVYNFLARKIYAIEEEKLIVELTTYFITRNRSKYAEKIIKNLLNQKAIIRSRIHQGLYVYIINEKRKHIQEERIEKLSKHPYMKEFGLFQIISEKI